MKGMSWPSKNSASWLSLVKILGSLRMLTAVFWARAWRTTLRLTLEFSTVVSKRPGRKLFLVLVLELAMETELSALVGVMAWLLQRRPRLRASSRWTSTMTELISTWRPGWSRLSTSWITEDLYSSGAITMRAFARPTGTMRTWPMRLELLWRSVGGRARCHQKAIWLAAVFCWVVVLPWASER